MNDVLKEIAVIYGAGFGTGVAVVFFCEQVLSIVREILADLKNKKGWWKFTNQQVNFLSYNKK